MPKWTGVARDLKVVYKTISFKYMYTKYQKQPDRELQFFRSFDKLQGEYSKHKVIDKKVNALFCLFFGKHVSENSDKNAFLERKHLELISTYFFKYQPTITR